MAKRNACTPEKVKAAYDLVAEGMTLTAAAKKVGTSASAIRYQVLNSAELFEYSARARESGCDSIADDCIRIADDPDIDAANKRIMVDTRIRLIGKWSQRYNDKLVVENSTTVTHRYELDNLSDDELDTLEAIARKAAVSRGDQSGEGAAVASSVH